MELYEMYKSIEAIATNYTMIPKMEQIRRRSALCGVGSVRRGSISLKDLDRSPCVGRPVEFDQRDEKALRVVGPAVFQGSGFQFWPAERDGLAVAQMFFGLSRQSYAF